MQSAHPVRDPLIILFNSNLTILISESSSTVIFLPILRLFPYCQKFHTRFHMDTQLR